jgi:hypothetical protein
MTDPSRPPLRFLLEGMLLDGRSAFFGPALTRLLNKNYVRRHRYSGVSPEGARIGEGAPAPDSVGRDGFFPGRR